MKRRWRLLTGLALVLFVGASVLHPAVHWRIIGWAKGEAFYQGRPSSYWRNEIRKTAVYRAVFMDHRFIPDPKPDWAPELFRPLWGESFPDYELCQLDMLRQKAGIPVLVDLCSDPDPRIRDLAGVFLRLHPANGKEEPDLSP
ncbi:hypothetical protein AYO44_07185 [Planctomycetaceae bacterium SCGC AG-212-F19]|nr:hypothetical protein AYO44_07185 [Planctomycetaceae bacterium SCGC AG-212-F19]